MDMATKEDTSSFLDINSDRILNSTECESSNATIVGSEPPESIKTKIGIDREIDRQIGEVCSPCVKKERIEAATHFCKNCKRFGKYMCHACLKDHSDWLPGHKKIYSLTEWKGGKVKSSGLRQVNDVMNSERVNDWLKKHPTTVTQPSIESRSNTTRSNTQSETHCSSHSYGDLGTIDQSTEQTPTEDYSSILDSIPFENFENGHKNWILRQEQAKDGQNRQNAGTVNSIYQDRDYFQVRHNASDRLEHYYRDIHNYVNDVPFTMESQSDDEYGYEELPERTFPSLHSRNARYEVSPEGPFPLPSSRETRIDVSKVGIGFLIKSEKPRPRRDVPLCSGCNTYRRSYLQTHLRENRKVDETAFHNLKNEL